ncbi:MAG: peptidoglycan DD-metalloendopeptidase family protein [Legionellales bacterium]|nr:peptidoglycan DD-metalloendopeptidase family protein [Legionellales bacterium]
MRFLISLILLFTLCTSMDVQARSESNDMNRQLKTVDSQIDSVQKTLSQNQVDQNKLEKELQSLEITIGELSQSLGQINKQIELQKTKLVLLQQQQLIYQQQLTTEQNAFASQIRSAYFMGQQNYLKLLLNQENPVDITRNMTYFQYLNHHRLALIAGLNTTLSQLASNQTKIEQQTQSLEYLRHQQDQQKKQLVRGQQARVRLLARLSQQINTNTQQLKALEGNKKNLQHLIETLRREASQSVAPSMPVPFAQMRGHLPWPTHGSVIMHYNTPIEGSDLNSNGVIIKAPEGQNVYAIYPGRVMFAGWLKGFGLLMIIDHGGGYMSLYGRNQSLFKKVGQDINAGDLVAQVGDTGGYNQSGLYFEIRYDGQPVNPEQWCH